MRLFPSLFLCILLSACAGDPITGTLPEGIFGSPDLGLRVDAAGDATLVRSCFYGDLGAITADDGVLVADFDWVRSGGEPSGVGEATPATLDATATTTKIVGTITSAGETTDLDLSFGEETTYFECP